LTGMAFEAIDDTLDSSPRYGRQILHLACGSGQEASAAADLQKSKLERSDQGSFLTFIDSRQGAERLAIRTDAEDVKPYRSGYEGEDRASIERALRDGSLRGVVSTSALELGLNIPHFSVGLNLNVPVSRKSFRQRLGRVGRQRPGAFAILAEPYAFRRFGESLSSYYETSVEPAYLYLQNRFIQYAHARCLADELEMLGVLAARPHRHSWGGRKALGIFSISRTSAVPLLARANSIRSIASAVTHLITIIRCATWPRKDSLSPPGAALQDLSAALAI